VAASRAKSAYRLNTGKRRKAEKRKLDLKARTENVPLAFFYRESGFVERPATIFRPDMSLFISWPRGTEVGTTKRKIVTGRERVAVSDSPCEGRKGGILGLKK